MVSASITRSCAHDQADEWRQWAPVAHETAAGGLVGREGPAFVGHDCPVGAEGAQREVAGDLSEAGLGECFEVGGVDLRPDGLSGPEASDNAERDLVGWVLAEEHPVTVGWHVDESHGLRWRWLAMLTPSDQ